MANEPSGWSTSSARCRREFPTWQSDIGSTSSRDARRLHKALGNPMATWKDGKVVWVQPEDIKTLKGLAVDAS